MMPLTHAKTGESNSIKRLSGKTQVRQHLSNLGLVAGTPITVIAKLGGNVIVNVKDSRLAISSEMASKIMI